MLAARLLPAAPGRAADRLRLGWLKKRHQASFFRPPSRRGERQRRALAAGRRARRRSPALELLELFLQLLLLRLGNQAERSLGRKVANARLLGLVCAPGEELEVARDVGV